MDFIITCLRLFGTNWSITCSEDVQFVCTISWCVLAHICMKWVGPLKIDDAWVCFIYHVYIRRATVWKQVLRGVGMVCTKALVPLFFRVFNEETCHESITLVNHDIGAVAVSTWSSHSKCMLHILLIFRLHLKGAPTFLPTLVKTSLVAFFTQVWSRSRSKEWYLRDFS